MISKGKNVMTYEEKLDLIINELVEARKRTRRGKPVKIFITKQSELAKKIIPQEVHELLLQLQDDGKIIAIKEIPSELEAGWEVHIDKTDYFLVEILDTFDSWRENFLLKGKGELGNISFVNLLKIYDVVIDIDQELQIENSHTVRIPLLPQVVRFAQLFPADDMGMRDRYKEFRWGAVEYLKKRGVVSDMEFLEDLGYGKIAITIASVDKFDEFYGKIEGEYKKRYGAQKKQKQTSKEKPLNEISEKKEQKLLDISYKGGVLNIKGNPVKLTKDSFRAKMLELLLKDDKNRKKEWSWDEVLEEIEGIKDQETLKENKKKFYPACDGLSKFIAQKTGINDLLIFNKSTVQINSKYL